MGRRQPGLGQLHGVVGEAHADRGLVEADLGGAVAADPRVARQREQRARGEGVPGDTEHHRLRVAVDAHEQPTTGPHQRGRLRGASRHLGQVEAGGELALAADDGDR